MRLQDEIDRDQKGSITYQDLEAWYIRDHGAPSTKKKKKGPLVAPDDVDSIVEDFPEDEGY